MSNYDQKRILIVNGDSIYKTNATGITMRSIFSQWDNDNILEITTSQESYSNTGNGPRTHSLQKKYYPILYLLNSKKAKSINSASKSTTNQESITNKRSLAGVIRKLIIATVDSLPLIPPKDLLKVVEEFEPDYIYTLAAGILPMKVALYLSKKTDTKVVLHFMDNWQETLYKDHSALFFSRTKLLRKLKNLYKRSNKNITISEEMAISYNQKWQKEHFAMMNSVPIAESVNANNNKSDIVKIVYAGGLHLDRWKSLLEVEQVIKSLNLASEKKLSLQIYTSDENRELYSHLFKEPSTIFENSVNHDVVSKVYESADILLHMESFNPEIQDFIKYSISTKIPEYMASCRPVLLYAPRDLTLTKYISENNVGSVSSDFNELSKQLIELRDHPEIRREKGNNGRELAIKNHSIESTVEKLKNIFE